MPRHSLKGKGNIQATLYNGKRYFSKTLALYHDRTIPGLENDFGVAFLLSGRAGNAVERNKIKRWLREDFRRLQGISFKSGAFVIKFKGVADCVSHPQLSKELEKLFNSISVDG